MSNDMKFKSNMGMICACVRRRRRRGDARIVFPYHVDNVEARIPRHLDSDGEARVHAAGLLSPARAVLRDGQGVLRRGLHPVFGQQVVDLGMDGWKESARVRDVQRVRERGIHAAAVPVRESGPSRC